MTDKEKLALIAEKAERVRIAHDAIHAHDEARLVLESNELVARIELADAIELISDEIEVH